jgi:hypothetical protein
VIFCANDFSSFPRHEGRKTQKSFLNRRSQRPQRVTVFKSSAFNVQRSTFKDRRQSGVVLHSANRSLRQKVGQMSRVLTTSPGVDYGVAHWSGLRSKTALNSYEPWAKLSCPCGARTFGNYREFRCRSRPSRLRTQQLSAQGGNPGDRRKAKLESERALLSVFNATITYVRSKIAGGL